MATYRLTINIESALIYHTNQATKHSSPSIAGHMWYMVQKNNEEPQEFGFASKNGEPFGDGKIVTDDGISYAKDPYYSRTVEITEEQYNKLIEHPKTFNGSRYDVLKNNCIKFTWDALEKAGFNTGGFQGMYFPDKNAKYIDELFDNPVKFAENAKSKYSEYPTSINSLGVAPKDNLPSQILDSIKTSLVLTLGLTIDGWGRLFELSLDGWIKLYDLFSSPFLSPTIYDPITLDLNKDGKIDTTDLDNGVYFDHNGDKVAMKTSWIGKEDGLLVHDRNNNGIIDDGSELFGNFTPLNPNNNLNDKNLAVNGYHALKSYDMNNDGIIDSNDEIYKHLKVWQDINGDGISQENELKTLEQANIKSLNLAFSNIDKDLDNGNNLMFEGNYTDNEGKEHKMADINFNIDTISSKHKDDITLNNEQANQINLQGSGNLRDLNQAAILSSKLNDILNSYKQANTKEEQLNLLPKLIKEWAKTSVGYTEYEHSLSSVTYFDENTPQGKLAVLRQRYAQATSEMQRAAIYQDMINTENKLAETNHEQALKEANQNKELLDIIQQSQGKLPSLYTPKNREIRVTPSQLEKIKQGLQDQNLLEEFDKTKHKIGVIDAFVGKKTGQLYYANDDDIKAIIQKINTIYDNILEYTYKTLLTQTRLKEYLNLIDINLNESKDTNGNIKYDFNLNYSKTIERFKEIAKKDPKKAFVDIGEFINLLRSNKDSSNITSFTNIFGELIRYASKNNLLEDFKLELATYNNINILTTSKDSNTVRGSGGNDTLYGGEGNDSLYGGEGEDNLYGNEGDDRLYGEKGNDILNGGAGNDYLDGGIGDDIYTFNKGDGIDTVYDTGGADTIKFGEGISKEDLIISKINDGWWDNTFDMVIRFKGREGDMLTIKDVYADAQTHSTNNAIERFEFSDGSTITLNELEANVMFKGTNGNDVIHGLNTNDIITGLEGDDVLNGYDGDDALYGNEGNDTLYSHSGNDTLYGGEGNDSLYGGEGEDTYIFNKGDGNDVINDTSGNNTIRFGEGISKEDLTFVYSSNNFSIRYGADDTIVVNGYASNFAYQINKIELGNGNFISNSQINKIIQDINSYARDNGITAISHDTIRNNQDMMSIVMSGWNS